jgi:hypothetical protein
MRRQAVMDAKSDIRMFWTVHKAAAALMGEDAADSATEYISKLREFVYGPPPPTPAAEVDAIMNGVGARRIQ